MKSNQKLTLLFWHRKSKADNNGNAPIICRISIGGEEEEMSIGRKVHLGKWDTESKRAIGGTEEKKTNQKIVEVTANLERHFTLLQLEHEFITPIMLKNVYNGLPAAHQKGRPKPEAQQTATLLQVADMHIRDFTKMVEKVDDHIIAAGGCKRDTCCFGIGCRCCTNGNSFFSYYTIKRFARP